MIIRNPALRSVFAVVDGLLMFVAVDALFYLVAYLGLHRSFDTPTVPYLTSNLIWAIVSALVGGYTAGWVAKRAPVLHGLIAALPLIAIAAFNLNKGVGSRRTPFVLAFNVLVPLAMIAGAYLESRRVALRQRA